jgi:hypothetical protein
MTTVQTIAGPFSKARYDKFVAARDKCVKQQFTGFFFEGEPVELKFANYLIEFLDPTFKNMK